MGIQSSINRMVYYAGAYKIASQRDKYWGAKAEQTAVKKAPSVVKKPSNKSLTMRKKALEMAQRDIEARVTQREAFTHIRNGGMF